MKTKLEIIEETVSYYGEDPSRRSADPFEGCTYLSSNGNKCAFSRCCTDKGVEHLHKYMEGEGISSNDPEDKWEGFLKPEYQGHNNEFWEDIQSLHDSDFCWDQKADNGLTQKGERRVAELKKKYA